MRRSGIATSCARARRWRRTPRSDGRTVGRSDWKLLVDPVGRPGDYNMSLDLELLTESARVGARYLRLYRWDPPTLSIGRNQPIQDLARDGIAVVRRPTGGQAVWHEHEVTYAVAAPISVFGSLRMAYREIHNRLATALHALGVDATLATARPPVRPSARPTSCFASPAGGEILAQGRKLVGSAQVRRADAFLQHGSILLDGVQPGGGAETTLAGTLGRSVSFDELATAIIIAWEDPLLRSDRPTVQPSDASEVWRR